MALPTNGIASISFRFAFRSVGKKYRLDNKYFPRSIRCTGHSLPYSKGPDTEEYCPQCDAVQSVVKTVAWQPNQCRECGTDLPDDTESEQ